MKQFSFLFILLLFCLPAQAQRKAPDSPLAVAPHWQEGDQKLLEIVQGKLRYHEGKMVPSDYARVMVVEIEVLEERLLSYRMQWTFREVKNMGLSQQADISQILANEAGSRLEFVTDKLGGFLQLSNWPEIQQRLTQKLEAALPSLTQNLSEPEAQQLSQRLKAIVADRAEAEPLLLKEVQLFHRPYGYWLYPNQTYTSESSLSNPRGRSLPTTLSVRWQEPEHKHTEAFVQLVEKTVQLMDSSNYVYNLKSGWLESSAYRRFEEGGNELFVSFCDMQLTAFDAQIHVEKLWAGSIEKYRQMDLKGALVDLDLAIAIAPNSAAYNLRALILSAMGSLDAAISDFDASLALRPLAWTYAHRAEVRSKKRDYTAAEADFRKALAMDSLDEDTWFLRARMWEDRLQYAKGMDDMNSLIRLAPRNAHAYAYRAFLKREQGMLGAALKDAERAARLAPFDPLVFRHKGLIHLSLDEEEQACQAFERALWLGFTELYDDEVERIMKAFCK